MNSNQKWTKRGSLMDLRNQIQPCWRSGSEPVKSSDEELKSPTKPEDQKNEVCMLDFTATFFNRLACGFLPASWALPYPVILGLSILPLVTAHKKSSSSSSSSSSSVCFYQVIKQFVFIQVIYIYVYIYIYTYIYIYIGSLFLADRNVVCWSPVFKVISQWRCEISESSVKSRCVFVELFFPIEVISLVKSPLYHGGIPVLKDDTLWQTFT